LEKKLVIVNIVSKTCIGIKKITKIFDDQCSHEMENMEVEKSLVYFDSCAQTLVFVWLMWCLCSFAAGLSNNSILGQFHFSHLH
jgi:hypothetical protein